MLRRMQVYRNRAFEGAWPWGWLATLLFFSVLATTGCRRSSPNSESGPSTSREGQTGTAREVFQKMLAAYRNADQYSDEAFVRLRYRHGGRLFEDEAPLRIVFERPNRLAVQVYQLLLQSDGSSLKAVLKDEDSNDFDQQMLVHAAPERLQVPELYTIDELMHVALRQGLAGYPVQLDLLLAEEPLEGLLASQPQFEALSTASCEGRPCHRIQLQNQDGAFVFWIDQQHFVLRRLEFPAEVFAAEIAADVDVSDLELTAEFVAAVIGPDAADPGSLPWQDPPDAHHVRNFVPPPEPLPSELIGQRPSPFSFSSLDGSSVAQQDLDGRIAVLVWFNNHAACENTLRELTQLRGQFADPATLQFWAVCTEPASVSGQRILQQLDTWQADLPVVRDMQAFGRDVFQVPWAPTLVVLDAAGRVQIYEVGGRPQLVERMSVILQRLVAGEDLAAEILREAESERKQYQQLLAEGGRGQPAEASIRPAFGPAKLKLRSAWSSDQLSAAGNLLVVRPADEQDTRTTTLWALNGWQSLVKFSRDGEILSQHSLELPEGDAVSYLRSASQPDGRVLLAGSALRAQHLHLLDGDVRRLAQYPPGDQTHDGLHDVLLADLDQDGQPEIYAGFWGLVGIHRVSLEGHRQWSNRAIGNVLTLAIAPADGENPPLLLATSDRGELIAVDAQGQHQVLAQTGVHHIYAARPAAGWSAPFCVISYAADGGLVATGLAADLSELWTYSLPAGSFSSQVQFVHAVQGGTVLPRYWLFAAPDGTLHLVGDDGQPIDQFGLGAAITGLAADGDRIFVATGGKVEAVDVE